MNLRKWLSLLVTCILILFGANTLIAQVPHFGTPPKVISLDMCADQYMLGLMPRDQIIALSNRSQLGESYYRDRAKGINRVKPSFESILALRPDVVVRTYGGDHRLIQALEAHGIKVVQINEVHSLTESRAELLRLGDLLDQMGPAQIEVRQFDKTLKAIVPRAQSSSILYYTPSGYSAGADTMIGDMLTRAGYRLETQNKGFFYISPEVFVSLTPDAYALGFFDDIRQYRRASGRSPIVMAKIEKKPTLHFPQRALACPGWFNVYDLHDLTTGGQT